MPGFPDVTPIVQGMTSSVFSALAHRLRQYEGPMYPLHVGDTWMAPAVGCRMSDFTEDQVPGMHRYSNPHGRPDLLEAIVQTKSQHLNTTLSRDEVLVTAGATGGLGAVLGAIVSPGEKVMILAPFWPLIAGIVRSFRGEPIITPLPDEHADTEVLRTVLDAHFTQGVVAIYLNTPNNPTGRNLPESWLETVAEWAREKGLWILADEVYDLYVYQGTHHYMHAKAPERTFSSFSFSKAYGMAGNRCGFVVGPKSMMKYAQKISTHSFYSTPTAAQLAAHAALTTTAGHEWVNTARSAYAALGKWAAARLGTTAPEGGTFLFLDVADALDDRGLMPLLESCVDHGVLLAPGPSFGPYPTHVRLCFTSVEPEIMKQGVEIFAGLIGR